MTKTFEDWETVRNAGIAVERSAVELFESLKWFAEQHRSNRQAHGYAKGECSGMGQHNRERGDGNDCCYCDAYHLLKRLHNDVRTVQHGPRWKVKD